MIRQMTEAMVEEDRKLARERQEEARLEEERRRQQMEKIEAMRVCCCDAPMIGAVFNDVQRDELEQSRIAMEKLMMEKRKILEDEVRDDIMSQTGAAEAACRPRTASPPCAQRRSK